MFGGGFLSNEYRIINNSTISRGLRKTYKQKNIRVSSHYVCVYDSVLSLDFSPSLFIWSVSERVKLVVSLGQYIIGNL